MDVKARKANRTAKNHAQGSEVVLALLDLESDRKGELTKEWRVRSVHPRVADNEARKQQALQMEQDGVPENHRPYYEDHVEPPTLKERALDNLRKIQRRIPDVGEAGISKSGDAVVLQHAWKRSNGHPLSVTIPVMNNGHDHSNKGPDRFLNQQECDSIEKITGHNPDALVAGDDGFDWGDDDEYEYVIPGADHDSGMA